MMGEPQLKPGTIGTIDYVDDIGQIHFSDSITFTDPFTRFP